MATKKKKFEFDSQKRQSVVRFGKDELEIISGESSSVAAGGFPEFGSAVGNTLTDNIYSGTYAYAEGWEAEETITPPSPRNHDQAINYWGAIGMEGYSFGQAWFHFWDVGTGFWDSNVIKSNSGTWNNTLTTGITEGFSGEFCIFGFNQHTTTGKFTPWVFDSNVWATTFPEANSNIQRTRTWAVLDPWNRVNMVVMSKDPADPADKLQFSHNRSAFYDIPTTPMSNGLDHCKIAVDLLGRTYVAYIDNDGLGNDLFVTYTDNPWDLGGATWSTPVEVVSNLWRTASNPNPAPDYEFYCRNGVVMVSYVDARQNWVRYATSIDRGDNFQNHLYYNLGFRQTQLIYQRFGADRYGQRTYSHVNLSVYEPNADVWRSLPPDGSSAFREYYRSWFRDTGDPAGDVAVCGSGDGTFWYSHYNSARVMRRKRLDTLKNPITSLSQIPGSPY